MTPRAGPDRLTLTGPDGVELALYRWARADAHGALVIVHGYGEHARRHGQLARTAQEAGWDVYAFDLRGHGESPGVRGSVPGFGRSLADLQELFRTVRADDPERTVLLFGHSMGGALSLRFTTLHPSEVSALALSSPFLTDAVKRSPLLDALAGPIARLLPNLPVARIDPRLISRDPAQVERYRTDPLIYHGGVRANAGYTLLEEGRDLRTHPDALTIPALVLVGTADGIADPAGARELAVANALVRLEELPGGYHELHHDDPATGTPQRFMRHMVEWLQANTRSTMNLR